MKTEAVILGIVVVGPLVIWFLTVELPHEWPNVKAAWRNRRRLEWRKGQLWKGSGRP